MPINVGTVSIFTLFNFAALLSSRNSRNKGHANTKCFTVIWQWKNFGKWCTNAKVTIKSQVPWFLDNMYCICSYLLLFPRYSKSHRFSYPRLFGATFGVIPLEFHQDLWQQKTTEFRSYCVHCLHHPTFIRIGRSLRCNRWTVGRADTPTQGQRQSIYEWR